MSFTYADYTTETVKDIVRLRATIMNSDLPVKIVDNNLLVASWNIRAFGDVFEAWEENDGSPKRNLRAMASIAEIIRQFDVIAIQEVKRETRAIRMLLEDFLGPDWGMIMSDVSGGDKGNNERLAYVYDKRRVHASGLAGEIVLPPTDDGNPAEQFDRTPYIAGFESGGQCFSLMTTHIRYGKDAADRQNELEMAAYAANEIRERAKTETSEETNLIVLGDFNIDKRGDSPLFQAFTATGLYVPEELWGLKTTYGDDAKFYDQIAWFMGDMHLDYSGRAGVIDFSECVYPEISKKDMSFRISDHFPMWVEFIIDRSNEAMAETLGVDPATPDLLDVIEED